MEEGKPIRDRVPNGTDGVLMHQYANSLTDTDTKMRPWLNPEVHLTEDSIGSLRHRPGSLLEAEILGLVSYTGYAPHYKQLLKCWLLSTFFATTQTSRPVPMFEGIGGAGKTTLGVRIGNILQGPHFAAINAPTSGKELAEQMTATPFVVFDEFDKVGTDVEKTFKNLTTGGKHRRRELYTTSHVIELSCDATVILTTNADPLREAASMRRFLVIPIAPRQMEAGEQVYSAVGEHLLPSLMAKRESIWAELLDDLSACVLALHNVPAATIKTSFSMADFGVFVQRIATFEKWGMEAERMFLATEKKQEEQAADHQVLAELLPELLASSPDLQGNFYSAREWADYFQGMISDYDHARKSKVTFSYVNYIFKTWADLYRRKFGLEERINSHTKTKQYSLRLTVTDTPTEKKHAA